MSGHREVTRRRFIRFFTLGAASATVLGRPWRGTVLAESDPTSNPIPAVFRLNINDYPPLQQAFGSVRLSVNPIQADRPSGYFWPMIINRGAGDEFFVLDSNCPHQGCVVAPLSSVTGTMTCPCHGSTFEIDGSFASGPAQGPLQAYEATFEAPNQLMIRIPNLGFCVAASVIPEAPTRLRLEFPTFAEVQYEVHSRAGLGEEWSVTAFGLSAEGPLDQSVLTGNDFPASVYVDRSGGVRLFAVSMRLIEV